MIRLSFYASVYVIIAVAFISCKTSNKDATGPAFALNEMIKDVKSIGDAKELREVDPKRFKRENELELMSEVGDEVTFRRKTVYGDITMTYETRDGVKGVLQELTFHFKEGMEYEKLDKMSKKLNNIFEEKPKVDYGKPVSNQDKEKIYRKFVNSNWKGAFLYYGTGEDNEPILILRVSGEFRDISKSYYLSKIYDYNLQ